MITLKSVETKPVHELFQHLKTNQLFKLDLESDEVFMKVTMEGVTYEDYSVELHGMLNISTGIGNGVQEIDDCTHKNTRCYLVEGEMTYKLTQGV